MPVPIPDSAPPPLFPPLSRAQVDAARTSTWYDTFEDLTVPAVVIDIDALGERDAFLEWIDSDSIFLPEGSEATPVAPADGSAPIYRLPKLNAAIRAALERFGGAVFPKLNWTSPRDAAFLLPQTAYGPLHCTSPADVYLLLKSSDFVQHDIDPARAYEAAAAAPDSAPLDRIELVLKKFVEMNPSREVRCFVRDNILLGISQRDSNFYDHLQGQGAQVAITDTVRAFWEDEVMDNYEGAPDYVFDLLLDEKCTSALLLDFQPYRESTDALLFTYPELRDILETALQPVPSNAPTPGASRSSTPPPPPPAVVAAASDPAPATGTTLAAPAPSARAAPAPAPTPAARPRLPILRVIDSAAHPDATRNMPSFSANMMPVELLEMSAGRSISELSQAWEAALAAGMEGSDDDDGDDGVE